MSVTYSPSAKASRMTAIRDLLNSGKLEIGTAAMAATLVTFTLNASSGSVSGGVLTFSGFPKTVAAAATGTAAAARLRTSADADVVTGLTVGIAGSGADVILDSTSISSGQNVTIAANPTLTHA